MADIVRSSTVSVDTSTAQFAPHIAGLLAGEDIMVGAPVYINSSDGLVYMSNGTAANEAAEIVGFSAREALTGEPITIFGASTRYHYSDGNLTPGDIYYLSTNAGYLSDVATTGDAIGVAQALTASDIRVTRDI